MSTKTTPNKTRNLADVERELQHVKAAQAAIEEELTAIAAKTDRAVKSEAEATEHSVREGKTPKASGQVAKLEQRKAELLRQRSVTEVLADKLLAEKLALELKEHEREQTEAGEAAEQALDEERRVAEVRVQKQNEFAWARERALSTREALVAVRRRLAERGIEEPTDLAEREENARQAEAHREHARQWAPTFNVLT